MSASSSFVGFRRVRTPAGANKCLEQPGRVYELDTFFVKNLLNTSDEGGRVLLLQRRQKFQQPPVGFNGREDADVLDLAGHHHFRNVFTLQNVDQFSKLADVDPV